MSDVGIIAVGGYNEVGKNMTSIRVGSDVVIMDMGLMLDRVQIYEDVETEKMHSLDLIKMGAIPDDTIMQNVDGNVRAIVCSHGHLDHIGAIAKLAHRYDAPIIATPFTTDLITHQIKKERRFGVDNKIIPLKAKETTQITEDLELEFIRVQHSIPDSVFPVLHTPKGAILYSNDFKFDRTPVLDEVPDMGRLRKLGKEGVLCMIVESTRVGVPGKAPSEKIAKDLVMDVLLSGENSDDGVIVTTFSSHIARIATILEAAGKMERIPVFLGRSMAEYVRTARKRKYIELPDEFEMCGNRRSVDKMLKRMMEEGKEKFLPIATGHQGEPNAVLNRIACNGTPYEIENGDRIVFSASKIPSPLNEANRYSMETKLKMKGARIYDYVHVSGHAAREDHWELLKIISPEHVIPAHGNLKMISAYSELAEEVGYILGENVHVLRNGQELLLDV
ncbi:MAG: RNase J family beta-CASP ribonuclease [Halobacteriota archaeon]|nr:RNase J family beta-CASP ribonuclease [Halobacteriota archaeon]